MSTLTLQRSRYSDDQESTAGTEHRENANYVKIHAIIHGASVASAGVAAGLAQVPLVDIPAIMAVQIPMVIAIGKEHGATVGPLDAEVLIGTVAARTLGVAISRQLIGWIPGFGNAIKAATAAGITEALGWAADAYFKNTEGEESKCS